MSSFFERLCLIVNSLCLIGVVCAISIFLAHIIQRGECVERKDFDIGNKAIGASGSYCSKWEGDLKDD